MGKEKGWEKIAGGKKVFQIEWRKYGRKAEDKIEVPENVFKINLAGLHSKR